MLRKFAFVLISLMSFQPAFADEIIANNSFELPAVTGVGNHIYPCTSLPSWTVTANLTDCVNIILPGAGYANNPSTPPTGGGLQYFDVALTSGVLTQTVTLPYGGTVNFSGWFSVRDFAQNLTGNIIQLKNSSGTVVATANVSFTSAEAIGLWKQAIAPSTSVVAGTYTVEVIQPNNANLDLMSLTMVPGTIAANADTGTPILSSAGGSSVANVLGNDTFNGGAVTISMVNLTVVTTATPIGGGSVPALNTTTGAVTVPAGTPNGNYTITYKICEKLNTTTCSNATATIQVYTPGISVVKSASVPTVTGGTNSSATDSGDTITFSYVVSNTGTVALSSVVPVDAGPKFNGINGTNTLGAFSPASASISVGASQTFTATYTLSSLDIRRAVGVSAGVTNTATAQGTSIGGAITSASSSASTTITATPSLTITKTSALNDSNGGTANAADLNETIAYTYRIRNTGNVPVTAVTVNDVHEGAPLAAGLIASETLVSDGDLAPAIVSSDTTANNAVWSTLQPGAVVQFTYLHTVTQAEIDNQ